MRTDADYIRGCGTPEAFGNVLSPYWAIVNLRSAAHRAWKAWTKIEDEDEKLRARPEMIALYEQVQWADIYLSGVITGIKVED